MLFLLNFLSNLSRRKPQGKPEDKEIFTVDLLVTNRREAGQVNKYALLDLYDGSLLNTSVSSEKMTNGKAKIYYD